MDISLIFDYIENVKGVAAADAKITYVEDYVETHPEDETKILCTYSLFSVDYADQKGVKYIQTISSTANIVLPAGNDMLLELFPHYAESTSESLSPGETPSESREITDHN